MDVEIPRVGLLACACDCDAIGTPNSNGRANISNVAISQRQMLMTGTQMRELKTMQNDDMKIVNFFTPRFLRGIFLLSVFSTALCDSGQNQNDEVGMERKELIVKMSGRRTRLEDHTRKLKAKNGPPGERSNDNILCEDNANESLSRLFITTRDDVSSFGQEISETDPLATSWGDALSLGKKSLKRPTGSLLGRFFEVGSESLRQ